MANKRPLINKPCVLVLREKHQNFYFHIPDEETLLAAAIKTVVRRADEGYYFSNEPENTYVRGLARAAVDGNGHAAWDLLRTRKNYEYEGFELEPYEQL